MARYRSLRGYLAAAAFGGLLASLVLLTGTASANHMLPQPPPADDYPTFWDTNNNGGADDTNISVDAVGLGWTDSKLDRLTEATNEWANSTDFDPFRIVSGPYDVYIDGTEDPSIGCVFDDDDFALTCGQVAQRVNQAGPYYDIETIKTTFQPDPPDPGTYTWWYGLAHTGAELTLDFRGVATHELGHWVRLHDVSGSGTSGCNYGATTMYTMCGGPQNPPSTTDDDTWRLRGLTTHDITAANVHY